VKKAKRLVSHAVGKTPRPAKVTAAQHAVRKEAAQDAAATRKHNAHGKHGGTSKHSAKRGWSPDSDVACCSARAVAESLRIASGPVLSDDDVLGLYFRTTSDPDAGETILATLMAAQRYGLAGHRPFIIDRLYPPDPLHTALRCMRDPDLSAPVAWGGLILGLGLPQCPHAVVQHDGAWWSWGQPCDPDGFPGAVIEEAWAVTWQ
jgi:hypothetical protein